MRKITMTLVASILCLLGCREQGPAVDFSTPEGAILMLEDAYRRKDLEAAVGAKDFLTEARVGLAGMKGGFGTDEEILKKTAEVLELTFRAEMKSKGFPDFRGVKSRFPKQEKYQESEDIVVVTEVCTYPDGGVSTEKLLVTKTPNGWRVLHVLK